jgi:transcriptional regulator with XRE-family HTH domain
MAISLRITQQTVKAIDAFGANDWPRLPPVALRMGRPTRTDRRRFHYIVEWAEHRRLTQADIMRALGVDKSTVSRWFSGSIPSEMYLIPLTALLTGDGDEPAALFRHPDDDWMARLLRGRTADEERRIKAMIEAAFPRAA